jgi:hypothetical protein
VRRPVVGADVRLELDDPADPPTGLIVTDEERAEEAPRRVEGRPRQERPQDDWIAQDWT